MTEQAAPAAHAVDKNVTESPKSVIGTNANSPPSPTPAPAADESHTHAHAAASHPESALTKTAESPSKTSLSSSLKTDGGGSMDRDSALAKVQREKTMSNVKAWEESRKAKANNRCSAVIAKIGAWEAAKKAAAEAKLKQSEEKLEKKRAALVEKMRNQIAAAHKLAEERRALAQCQEGEELFRVEEQAAKYRAQSKAPGGGFLCFKS